MLNDLYSRLDKPRTLMLLAILTSIVVAEIILTVLIPQWRNYFYNILQQKQEAQFLYSIALFFLLMTGLGAAQGVKVWVGQLFSFELRKSASKILLKKWTKTDMGALNYTQAQTESLRNSTELFVEVSVEAIISAAIVLGLVASNIHNPSILLAAIVYTVLVSGAAVLFNRPLINSDAAYQQAEGQYREALGDIHNGHGDFTSKEKFLNLVSSYYKYIKVLMGFTLFSRIKGSLASVVPYVLLAGSYFSGGLSLGEFMAGVATFELIVINSTILVLMYPKLTKSRASYNITKKFYEEVKGDDVN